VWRARTAFAEHCWEVIDDPLGPLLAGGGERFVLRTAGQPEQTFGMTCGLAQLALRGGSFAAFADRRGRYEVWRLMDGGRRCPARVAEADPDNAYHAAIGIGGGRLCGARRIPGPTPSVA